MDSSTNFSSHMKDLINRSRFHSRNTDKNTSKYTHNKSEKTSSEPNKFKDCVSQVCTTYNLVYIDDNGNRNTINTDVCEDTEDETIESISFESTFESGLFRKPQNKKHKYNTGITHVTFDEPMNTKYYDGITEISKHNELTEDEQSEEYQSEDKQSEKSAGVEIKETKDKKVVNDKTVDTKSTGEKSESGKDKGGKSEDKQPEDEEVEVKQSEDTKSVGEETEDDLAILDTIMDTIPKRKRVKKSS